MVPTALYFGLFFFVPFALIVAFSFWHDENFKVIHRWTLENYRYFLSQSVYRHTLLSTAWVALLSTAITLGLAFPFAYWLSRYVPQRLQKLLLVLVIVPFWTSYLLRVYAWLNLLGNKGLVNTTLEKLGVIAQPLSLLNHRWTVVVVLVYLYFPFAALTLYSSIDRFDWDQLLAAMDLGASPLTALRRILVPQIRAGITTAVIFVFIPILGEYVAPDIVGGIEGRMTGNQIDEYRQYAEYARAASLSLIVAGFIILLLILFRKSLSTKEAYGA
jgi:spermidine/putrescine transport system permease protein